MPLVRQPSPKPKREPHKCVPIVGEFGRFTVDSRSAAKAGHEEAYIVDVLEKEQTVAHGEVTGTCGCKGFSVRGTCSHLVDAKAEHERIIAAEKLGFKDLDREGEASSD